MIPPEYRWAVGALSAMTVALFLYDRWPGAGELEPLPYEGGARVYREDEAPRAVKPGEEPREPDEPTPAPGGPVEGEAWAPKTMSEEERSARNEELIRGLERQKKEMGIERALTKEELEEEKASRQFVPPGGRNGRVLKTRAEFARVWKEAGLPGAAPKADFAGKMAILMIKPAEIVRLTVETDHVRVVYRRAPQARLSRRWRMTPLMDAPVLFVPEKKP